MRYSEHEVVADDATKLFVRHYQPDHEVSRTLMIVHGASEHGARYEHVSRSMLEYGWNVIVGDIRGHGRSQGTAMYVEDFHRYVLDLETIRQYFGLEPHQTAILGHSMGGLISIRDMQVHPGRASALVVTSPLLRVKFEIPRLMLALGHLAYWVAPRTRFTNRVDSSFTTRNPEALERRLADPLIHHSVTPAWFFAMRAALRAAWDEAERLEMPLLFLQAGADQIVDPQFAGPWVQRVGSLDKTYKVYPEHYHELLNEIDWRDTADSIANWLDARFRRISSSRSQERLATQVVA